MEKYLEKLRHSKLFTGIAERDVLLLLQKLNAYEKVYKNGEYLHRATDSMHDMGLILSGKIHMFSVDFWGKKFIFAEYAENELFGEAHSLTPEEPLLFDIVSVGESHVLRIDFNRLPDITPTPLPCQMILYKNLMKITAKKKIAFLHKIECLSRKTLRDKIVSYLSVQAGIHHSSAFSIPFNRQEMADYLSADRSALSQELGKMKKEGLIDFKHNYFELISILGA